MELGEIEHDEASKAVALRNKNMTTTNVDMTKFRTSSNFSYCDFFSSLGAYIYDSYLFCLLAAEGICDGNFTIRAHRLEEELHQEVIHLYKEGAMSNLHSCLKETIKSAIGRMAQLQLLDSRSYLNQNGSQVTYLSASLE